MISSVVVAVDMQGRLVSCDEAWRTAERGSAQRGSGKSCGIGSCGYRYWNGAGAGMEALEYRIRLARVVIYRKTGSYYVWVSTRLFALV